MHIFLRNARTHLQNYRASHKKTVCTFSIERVSNFILREVEKNALKEVCEFRWQDNIRVNHT
jgi:hypothetical protein